MVLIDKPINWKNSTLMTTETGILIPIIIGERASRKKNNIINTAG